MPAAEEGKAHQSFKEALKEREENVDKEFIVTFNFPLPINRIDISTCSEVMADVVFKVG